MLTLVFDGVPLPAAVDADLRITARWSDQRGTTFAVGRIAGQQGWIEWPGFGVFQFDLTSSVVNLAIDAGVDRGVAAEHFHRVVQPLVLQAQGRPVLHASAAASTGGALVVCGVSGSGKSTFAYALAARPGWRQIADDTVVVRNSECGPGVIPMPFVPRLRPSAAAYFPPPRQRPMPSEVALPRDPTPLLAVIELEQLAADRDPSETSVSRLSQTDAFRTLLTHAHCFDTGHQEAVRRLVTPYLELAGAVPVLKVTYVANLDHIGRLAETVLAHCRRLSAG